MALVQSVLQEGERGLRIGLEEGAACLFQHGLAEGEGKLGGG